MPLQIQLDGILVKFGQCREMFDPRFYDSTVYVESAITVATSSLKLPRTAPLRRNCLCITFKCVQNIEMDRPPPPNTNTNHTKNGLNKL